MIRIFNRIIAILVLTAFITTSGQMPTHASTFATERTGNIAPSYPQVSSAEVLSLPEPGAMISLSPAYVPVIIKGLRVHPDNPLLFDFIIDSGNSGLDIHGSEFKIESNKLIKYFLAALTIKEDDLWVNLSPYEKDRMIPKELGQTEMGRDMLAQDYILKQLTASLIYPEKQLGKEFWDKVYALAQAEYGTTNIPINTFNKVWIVAEKAKIAEEGNVAFVTGGHLKVMLEEDYLSLQKHNGLIQSKSNKSYSLSSSIVRQIIIPEIEKEVNQGKNFAPLRQMFYSMILASWYKLAIKNALLNQVFADQKKVGGLSSSDQLKVNDIYTKYLQAYKKGVFNFIKDDKNLLTSQSITRKYFSGGVVVHSTPEITQLPKSSEGFSIKPVGNLAMVGTKMVQRMVNKIRTIPPRKKLFIYASTLAAAGLMAIWVNENVYKLRLSAIPGYAQYKHLTSGVPVEDVPFLELVGDLQRADLSGGVDEREYFIREAEKFLKNKNFKDNGDKRLFLSSYWSLKLDVLQSDFNRLKGINTSNNPNSSDLEGQYKEISDQAREIYSQGHNEIRDQAYQILIAALLERSYLHQHDPILFYQGHFGTTNKVYLRALIVGQTSDKSRTRGFLRLFASDQPQFTSKDFLVEIPIQDELGDTSGKAEFRNVYVLANLIIDGYKSTTDLHQKARLEGVLRFIDRSIEGEEILNPISDEIHAVLGLNGDLGKIEAPGGIDLNSKNMDLGISKNVRRIQMRFDPAMVTEFRQNNFDGILPNIVSITPLDLKSFSNLSK